MTIGQLWAQLCGVALSRQVTLAVANGFLPVESGPSTTRETRLREQGSAADCVRFISIDDHPVISESLARAAEDYDDVEMVGSFTSIESVPKPYRAPGELADVAVLDLNLQSLSGQAGVETVAGWGLRVLVFSASAQSRIAEESIRRGATGFASKSVPTVQLLDTVRQVARGRQVIVGTEVGDIAPELTTSDRRLLEALTATSKSKQLGVSLGLSPRTVDNMIADLYWKLGIKDDDRTRATLRDWARRNGYGDI